MANEMIWTTQSGFLSNAYLDMQYRRQAQPLFKFRNFVSVKSAFGKSSGESVNWMKANNLGSYGGKLTETTTIPEATQALAWGTLSVNEYGLAVPYTFKAETLSKFDVEEILRTGLLDDTAKTIEGEIENQFFATALKASGTATGHYALATNATVANTNTGGLSVYHIRRIVLDLKKRNVPGYSKLNGDYVGILSVEAIENIQKDLIDVKNVQYSDTGMGKVVINGDVGRILGVRLVEDSWGTRFIYDSTARTATAKENNSTKTRTGQATSWTNASQGGDAYFFGSPTVMEAYVVPEGIRRKIPGDYGRDKGVAWYGLFGWKIMWGDTTATEADARIIHWSSL